MIKSELAKLRTLNATKEMMQKAKENEVEIKTKTVANCIRTYKRKYGVYLRCQQLGKYLKIAVFLPKEMIKGIKTPKFEIFINLVGGDYLTREWENGVGVWRTAMINNLDYGATSWSYFYDSKEYAWINREGNEHIKKLLKTKKGGYLGISEYQSRIKKEKLEEKRKKETRPWDEDMQLIPALPKGFEMWWKKEVIREHFIFYQYKRAGVETGYCSYCEKEVPVKKPKHGKEGKCPSCHRKIVYKAMGKIKRLYTKDYHCQVLQKIKGGFCIRTFTTYKTYNYTTYDKPKYAICEGRRTLYQDNRTVQYAYELYKNNHMRWVKSNYVSGYRADYVKVAVYGRTVPALEKTILKQSAAPKLIREKWLIDIDFYLRQEEGNTALEKLVKLGMKRLTRDFLKLEYDPKLLEESETELHKLLKLDKSRLNRLRKLDGNIYHLKWLQMEKRVERVFDDKIIQYFGDAEILFEDFDFLVPGLMSYQKIYNYMLRQQSLIREEPHQVLTTWRDYLNMAEKAKMDVKCELIYKPKDLKRAHSEVTFLLQQKGFEKTAAELRKKWDKVDEICKTLKKYEMQGEKYCVVAPEGILDIVKEGTTLRHCIHTCDFYFDRIQRKESYLLFLRWSERPDVPYYTLEVEPSGNIRQKRTLGDNQNEDFKEAVGFLKKWQKEIKKRLTKEDKELGVKSDELRRKNYAQIKKDGKLIWHGKLAGKPLADVLEADFMEAL